MDARSTIQLYHRCLEAGIREKYEFLEFNADKVVLDAISFIQQGISVFCTSTIFTHLIRYRNNMLGLVLEHSICVDTFRFIVKD